MVQKIDNVKLQELLLEYYRGPIRNDGSGFRIRCPWHDDHNPSCNVFHGSGKFFCFVCHGDKKKGERGVRPYHAFQALGMPEAKARQLFLQGTDTLYSDTIVFGRAPSLVKEVMHRLHNVPPPHIRSGSIQYSYTWRHKFCIVLVRNHSAPTPPIAGTCGEN